MQKENNAFDYFKHVVVVGYPQVGKTSFIRRYVHDRFSNSSVHTLADDYFAKIVKTQDACSKIVFFDTNGAQYGISRMPNTYFRLSSGIIIVYDVSNRQSYHQCLGYLQQIQQKINEIAPELQIQNVQYMLIATKIDLNERQVNTDEGLQFAKDNKMLFFEVSSLTSENVQLAFETLAQQLVRNQFNGKIDQENHQNKKLIPPTERYNCI